MANLCKLRTVIAYFVPSVEGLYVPVLKPIFFEMLKRLLPTGKYFKKCIDYNEHYKNYYIIPY